MKRTWISVGVLVLALLSLTACRRAFLPAPEATELTPVPAETAPVTLPPAPEETPAPIGEGFYPGGLDDDGRGEDELEAEPLPDEELEPGFPDPSLMDEIPLTPDGQYEANVFLSNFAEQFFGDFSTADGDALERLVDFAHIWCKINDRGAIVYAPANGTSYETLSLDQIDSVVNRYFPTLVSAFEPAENYPETERSFFRNDTFYFPAADGEAYNRIAVADWAARQEDGSIYLAFTVYEVALEEYFDQGVDRAYYRLTPAEAAAHPSLTAVANGEAVALPSSYNGRDTYQLWSYFTW